MESSGAQILKNFVFVMDVSLVLYGVFIKCLNYNLEEALLDMYVFVPTLCSYAIKHIIRVHVIQDTISSKTIFFSICIISAVLKVLYSIYTAYI